MAAFEQSKLFYDISAIKEIPILDVADQLGLSVQKKGKNFWCKVRNEENPSVILHYDRNSFYDFGNQVHGDVIHFVQYAKDLSFGAAVRFLGEGFGLEPSMTRQEILDRPLTDWEYSKIGLHGDMATKNLVFPIETASMEELSDLSWYYRMPMNKLQNEHPKLYRDLIECKAVPYVESMRNSYFLDVWNYFHLAYALAGNSINLFRSEKVRDRFRKDTAGLNRAERILYRARKNAGIEAPEPSHHDPVDVIRRLLHGDLTIVLGNSDNSFLHEKAKQTGASLCNTHIPLYSYFDDHLQQFDHAAEYRAGQVTVTYLSSDKSEIEPLLNKLRQTEKRPLEERILQASQKQKVPATKERRDLLEIY